MNDHSIEYYDAHGAEFAANTIDVDMSDIRSRFLKRLGTPADILDAGCGSGRDSLAFSRLGHRVTSIDASATMVELTRSLNCSVVHQLRFQDMSFVNEFDAIWACASLLHVRRCQLPDVIHRMYRAARPGGILYLSFKWGTEERESRGRHFTDFTVESLQQFFRALPFFSPLELWETGDQRPERREERWTNALYLKS